MGTSNTLLVQHRSIQGPFEARNERGRRLNHFSRVVGRESQNQNVPAVDSLAPRSVWQVIGRIPMVIDRSAAWFYCT